MIAVLFDTETTGLTSSRLTREDRQPEVIDFYAARVDLATGEVLEELEFLCCPHRTPIHKKITEITGLTDEDLLNKFSFCHYSEQVKSILESAPAAIAQNASFDVEMIDMEMARCKNNIEWPRLICTVEETVHLRGHRLNLTALHQEMTGQPFADSHRAKPDTQALIRVAAELWKRGMI